MKHNINVQKTATYHTIGDIKSAKTIWIVLHGYGMLAEFFIKKFEPILNDTTCIVAPEGLSRFYLKGYFGRVGATWMTKEDRENEIEDYINYLNQLYQIILKENSSEQLKVNVLGFSQGGATASRWIANSSIHPDNFILWASSFAHEIDLKNFTQKFETFILFGNGDEFLNSKYIKEQELLLKKSKVKYKLIEFNGIHDIPEDVLIKQTKKHNW